MPEIVPGAAIIADVFRKRADKLSLISWAILIVIFLLIPAGGYVFWIAADITRSDITTDLEGRLKDLRAKRDGYVQQASSINNRVSDIRGKIDALIVPILEEWIKKYSANGIFGELIKSDYTIQLDFGNVDDFDQLMVSFRETVRLAEVRFKDMPKDSEEWKQKNRIVILLASRASVNLGLSYEDANSLIDRISTISGLKDLTSKLKNIKTELQAAEKQSELYSRATELIDQKRAENLIGSPAAPKMALSAEHLSIASLVQTNITRFGTLAIIIFLVSLLMSLYRYNMRLSAFYRARSDALILNEGKKITINFTDLSNALTPSVDFGRQPHTPVEQLIELVRAASGEKAEKKPEKSE